jgi:hypothetical protein
VDLREIGWGDMHWIHLAQDRDQWWALVNTIMNLWIPLNVGKFLIPESLLASQEGHDSMELVS